MAVTPRTPHQSSPSSFKKRKVTPSFEASSPKRSLKITTSEDAITVSQPGAEIPVQPLFAPKVSQPEDIASVVEQHTHAHPSRGAAGDYQNETWHVKHVLLPYNLRNKDVDIFADDVVSMLRHIFPGTLEIGEARGRSHLTFTVEKLPSAPWPLTIGGLPFTVDSNDQGLGFITPISNMGNLKISICHEHNITLCEREIRSLAADVNASFRENLPELHITELIVNSAQTIEIVLGGQVDIPRMRRNFPGRIGGWPVGYVHETDMHRPAWEDLPARRKINPQPDIDVVDNSGYDVLRPGVLINSRITRGHAHSVVLSTTSGLLVQNSSGDRYMTGAYHGVEDSASRIGEEERTNQIFGDVTHEFPALDISLLQLRDGVKFVNETFEDENGVAPKFTRFVNSDDDVTNWQTNLNSPYTGTMAGVVLRKSIKYEGQGNYTMYQWDYIGQPEGFVNPVSMPPGICGSVIWSDEGIIMGFFRFYISEGAYQGFCVSLSASELARKGFSLVLAEA